MTNFLKILALSTALVLPAGMSHAQIADDEVIVTGGRIGSGGAQDIKHFRGGIESGTVPSPKGMTSVPVELQRSETQESSEGLRSALPELTQEPQESFWDTVLLLASSENEMGLYHTGGLGTCLTLTCSEELFGGGLVFSLST